MLMEGERQTNTLLEVSIREARTVLTEHHDYLSGNETATRTLIIDGMS